MYVYPCKYMYMDSGRLARGGHLGRFAAGGRFGHFAFVQGRPPRGFSQAQPSLEHPLSDESRCHARANVGDPHRRRRSVRRHRLVGGPHRQGDT